MTVLAGSPATAQSPLEKSAIEFIQSVYMPYTNGARFPNGPNYYGADAERIFSPQLASLLNADNPPGDEGRLDHDPLCACQDPEGLHLGRVVLKSSDDTAYAKVSMFINKQPSAVLLTLAQINGKWRISDISESGIPSLVKYLGGNVEPLALDAEPKGSSPLVRTTTWKFRE